MPNVWTVLDSDDITTPSLVSAISPLANLESPLANLESCFLDLCPSLEQKQHTGQREIQKDLQWSKHSLKAPADLLMTFCYTVFSSYLSLWLPETTLFVCQLEQQWTLQSWQFKWIKEPLQNSFVQSHLCSLMCGICVTHHSVKRNSTVTEDEKLTQRKISACSATGPKECPVLPAASSVPSISGRLNQCLQKEYMKSAAHRGNVWRETQQLWKTAQSMLSPEHIP